jgi:PAS domain S-box-containing protein
VSESAKSLRLLVVEDADDDYRILLREVRRGGYDVTSERVTSAAELAKALEQPWDLLITDWLLPGFGGLQAIESVVARSDGMPCIVISGTPNEDEAMAAIRAGALDFLSKDRPTRFVPAIERALREAAEYRRRIVSERELRLSEERYRSAFDRAPEALLTFDLDRLKIVDANVAATKLYGRSVDELRTADFVELSATKLADGRVSLDVATDVLRQMRTGAELAPFEWLVRHKSGEEIPAEVHLVRLAGDQLVRLTVIDLRERRKLEEIRQRTIELELQNRRIQEANRLKSEFLANMSHELRTPLNAIIGFSELLHDGQVPASSPEHQEFLGDILTSGRHLLQLINDVLDLAKVEAGKLDFRPEPVDLTKLVQEMISITRTTAATKRITV